jgi:hypothetical protein
MYLHSPRGRSATTQQAENLISGSELFFQRRHCRLDLCGVYVLNAAHPPHYPVGARTAHSCWSTTVSWRLRHRQELGKHTFATAEEGAQTFK